MPIDNDNRGQNTDERDRTDDNDIEGRDVSRGRSRGAFSDVTNREGSRRTFLNRTAMLGSGLLALSTAGSTVAAQESEDSDRPGYTDTPILPDTDWHVHDPDRPWPSVVDPGEPRLQDTPSDASILFDGTSLTDWESVNGGPAEWNIVPGKGSRARHAPRNRRSDCVIEVEPGTGDIRTTTDIGDCQLYLEFKISTEEDGDSQDRGNSGVFLMEQYEIQVLDSYENPTYADGSCSAIYGQYPPLVNASRPQGEWQTYNIFWEAPRFEDGELESPARATVLHNGVLVHANRELIGPTTHRDISEYEQHAPEAPLRLQDHSDQVQFGNVWYRPLD